MPYTTTFFGSLQTDKPMPDRIQTQIAFLAEIDTRSLTDTPPSGPRCIEIPDGFPADEIAALPARSMFHCHFHAESDTEIAWTGNENTHHAAAWIQFLIDTFLKPNGINATGCIEAAGEDVDDLWCIVVGKDQVVRTHEGVVIYDDRPSSPEAPDTGSSEPAPDRAPTDLTELWRQVREHPQFAFGAIFLAGDFPNNRIPDALQTGHVEEDMLVQYGNTLIHNEYGTPDEPHCEECGAYTAPTYESAPGAFHLESCSLYVDDDRER